MSDSKGKSSNPAVDIVDTAAKTGTEIVDTVAKEIFGTMPSQRTQEQTQDKGGKEDKSS